MLSRTRLGVPHPIPLGRPTMPPRAMLGDAPRERYIRFGSVSEACQAKAAKNERDGSGGSLCALFSSKTVAFAMSSCSRTPKMPSGKPKRCLTSLRASSTASRFGGRRGAFTGTASLDMYEEIAAEFMLREGEVVFRNNCDLLDEFTDAELADQLTAVWAERVGETDFARLVDAFAKLRSED